MNAFLDDLQWCQDKIQKSYCGNTDNVDEGSHYRNTVQNNNGPDERHDDEAQQESYCGNTDNVDEGSHFGDTVQNDNGPDERHDDEAQQESYCGNTDNVDEGSHYRNTVQNDNGPDERHDDEAQQVSYCGNTDNVDEGTHYVDTVQNNNGPDERHDDEAQQESCCGNTDNVDEGSHFGDTVQNDNGPDERHDDEAQQESYCGNTDNVDEGSHYRNTVQNDNGPDERHDDEAQQVSYCGNTDNVDEGTHIGDTVQNDNGPEERHDDEAQQESYCGSTDNVYEGTHYRNTVQNDNGPDKRHDDGAQQVSYCGNTDNVDEGTHYRNMVQNNNGPDERHDDEAQQESYCGNMDNVDEGSHYGDTVQNDNGPDERHDDEAQQESYCGNTDNDDEGSHYGDTVQSDEDDEDYVPESDTSSIGGEPFPFLSDITEDVSSPVTNEEESAEKSSAHYSHNKDTVSCSLEGHCTRKKPVPENERLYSRKTKIYSKVQVRNHNSSNGRSYDRVHACYFCKGLFTNIQSHLDQHFEDEVKQISSLKARVKFIDGEEKIKLQKEIRRLQSLLRNKGDNLHNLSVVSKQDGELLVSRRSKGLFDHREYGPCPECCEWIRLKENYRIHMKYCPCQELSPEYVKKVQQLIFENKVTGMSSDSLRKEVFPSMMRGCVSDTAKTDPLIMSLGEFHFMSNIANKMRRKNYTSYRMRLSARLLHLVRAELGRPSASFLELLVAENFDIFSKCSLDACGLDEEEQLKHPSTAVKLGHDLARLAAAKGTFAIKTRDEERRKEASDFAYLIEKEWKIKVKKRAVTILQQRQFNKFVQLPNPDDVAKLAEYLVNSLNTEELKPEPEVFNRVVILTEARLLLYNRRRPLEIEILDIETYHRRSKGVDETDLSLRAELTQLEKMLLESQELVELRGKGNQRVPILLPQEVKKPLQFLTSTTVREKCGVKPSNKFVFANTGDLAMRPGEALNIVKYEIKLKQPDRISATNLRKHTATISQVMGLEDHQLRWLVRHMGHTEKVHLQNYRATSGLIERLDIAKIMLMQEKNLHGRFAGTRLDDIQFEDIIDSEDPKMEPAAELASIEEAEEVASSSVTGVSVSSSSESDESGEGSETKKVKEKRQVKRVPWSKTEESELNIYFKEYVELTSKRRCPGMQECLQAIHKSKAAQGQLWKRSWETIKKKVSNVMKMNRRVKTLKT